MKRTLLLILSLFTAEGVYSQQTHVVTAPGNFSPADLVITEGDIVDFQISGHNAAEVDDATSNTYNGGFKTPGSSGGQITFNTPGIFHYICEFHPGMRGTITVQTATGINSRSNATAELLEVNPNPVNSFSVIKFGLNNPAEAQVVITNSMGIEKLNLGNRVFNAGENQIELNAEALNDGIYHVTLIFNDGTMLSKKIIVRK